MSIQALQQTAGHDCYLGLQAHSAPAAAELHRSATQAIIMANAIVNNTLPKMDASSAVFPTARVVGDSHIVAYHLPGCDTSAVIRFDSVKDWDYGYPNDEGLAEHPLWGMGLTFYEFHEVQPPEGDSVQWVGPFHDGTLTVRAKSVDAVEEQVGSTPWAATDARFGPGVNWVLDER